MVDKAMVRMGGMRRRKRVGRRMERVLMCVERMFRIWRIRKSRRKRSSKI